jgi:outer membrane protein OmpA-like peptidoglycan-associated protein
MRIATGTALGLTLGCAVLAAAPPVAAAGPDAQLFHPSLFSGGILGVDAGDVPGHLRLTAGAYASWADTPLQLVDARGETLQDGRLVRSLLGFELAGSLGLGRFLEAGVSLPVTAYQAGDATPVSPGALSSAAVGDVRLGVRGVVLRRPVLSGHLLLALAAVGSLPTGNAQSYAGTAGGDLEPHVQAELAQPDVGLTVMAGARVRGAVTVAGTTIGNAATFAAAGRVRLAPRLAAIATVQGEAGGAWRSSPVEVLGGVRYRYGRMECTLAGGAGLTDGYGTPAARVLIGVRFEPELPPEPVPPREPPPVTVVQRVVVVEDPDPDHDGVLGREDLCPLAPGPRENRGCPDKDTDGDGVVDRLDRCPTVAGPAVNQGCPDKDTDGDGVVDRLDRCPTVAGPAVNQGCPDKDTDGDGIPDRLDACPTEPGPAHTNGCPDAAAPLAVLTRDRIEIRQAVRFDAKYFGRAKWRVDRESYPLLATVARILTLHPEIRKLRIEGHADNRGSRAFNELLSLRRAEAVRDHLIELNGIEPERLVVVAMGFRHPVASNDTEAGRARNRRVEFIIAERGAALPPRSAEPRPPAPQRR